MRNVQRLLLLIVILSLSVWFGGCQTVGPGNTVTVKTDTRLKGMRRTYRLHVPAQYNANGSYPLVIAIHGAFSNAKQFERETGFSRLADEAGFLVAYPNGFGILGFLQHWNAGHCCDKAKKDGIDDVGFIAEVMEDVQKHVAVNEQQIYVVGFSNGGMLAHRLAAERSETVAAAAAIAGSISGREEDETAPWIISQPKVPVPMLIMHGDADDSVPYGGGESERHGGQFYGSADEASRFWAAANQASASPQVETLRQRTVELKRWQSNTGVPTEFYTLKGWSHQWPGLTYTAKLAADHPMLGFDGTRIIWDFLKDQQREP